MDLHHKMSSRYQVLPKEENERASRAVEPAASSTHIAPLTTTPSPAQTPTPTRTPTTSPSAPRLAFSEWSLTPPPYGPEPEEEAETILEAGVPPPYCVATSLPTYDEAERAKAAALGAGEPPQREGSLRRREEPPAGRPDPLRVGSDGLFMTAFFMSFIFNWAGFCLSFCLTTSAAGRYGALCGLGLSLTKWTLIIRFSDYFTGYFTGQYWLWWIFLLLGLVLFFRGFYCYLRIRSLAQRWAASAHTRYIFSS